MRRLIVLGMMIFDIYGFEVIADEGHEHPGQASSVSSITGEVMDLFCYSTHPDTGKGPAHAKCARQCIQKGIPPGILTQDGVLYVALGADHGPANKALAPYAGKVVEVKGQMREINNVKFFEVNEVKEK